MDKKGETDYDHSVWFGQQKEKGIAGLDDLFYRIMNKETNLPLLMGIDPELDKIIAKKLKG